MDTSAEFLKRIKEKYPTETHSDYATARLLGITPSAMSLHKSRGVKAFSDETGERIAQLLELPPAYVLACLNAERTKRPTLRAVWQDVARAMSRAAMLLIGLVIVTAAGVPNTAKAASDLTVRNIHYAQWRRWLCSMRRALALLLLASSPAIAAPGILAHQAEFAELLPAELPDMTVRAGGERPAPSSLIAVSINTTAPAHVAAIRAALEHAHLDLTSVALAYPLHAPASVALRVDGGRVTVADVASSDPHARQLAGPLRDAIARVDFPADVSCLLFVDVAPSRQTP